MRSSRAMTVEGFIAKWAASEASERANKDSFLKELCGVLGVPEPDVVTGDADRDRYVFEKDATLVHDGKKNSVGKMDLYKHGCFVLEAKQGSNAGAKKLGSGRRGTAGWTVMMLNAFGQAMGYARVLDDPPPFLVVCDIGHCFDLYACFDGSRTWKPFPDAQREAENPGRVMNEGGGVSDMVRSRARQLAQAPQGTEPRNN